MKKITITFLLLCVSTCFFGCVNQEDQQITDKTINTLDTTIKPEVSSNFLEKITTGYTEQTDDSLKSYIQIINDDSKMIVVASSPLEAGMDSWELGEMLFIDSTDNSYQF